MSEAKNTDLNILITGGGLIGGTLALDYSRKLAGAEIVVYEVDPAAAENLRQELSRKEATNIRVVSSDEELLDAASRADVVDHCVPIDALETVQEKISDALSSGVVITNRGSAQSYASASISPHVDNGRNIYHFGIHPVVGRERKPGQPLEIHEGTFENQTAIMQPLSENAGDEERAAFERLKFINEAIGFNVKILPLNVHDRLLGALSHENTLGLQTLVNTREEVKSGLGATIMRAASGTTGMWSPIHEFNSVAVTDSFRSQKTYLQRLEGLLELNDEDALRDFIVEANAFRSEWNDPDRNIESLDQAMTELDMEGATQAEKTSQIAVPFAVSIARTMGIKETVASLEGDLARYGHVYTDLLNSSARDSKLAAKYPPEEVAQLLLDNRAAVLEGLRDFTAAHGQIVQTVASHANGDKAAKSVLHEHIEKATNTMAADETPKPRRSAGGDGFDAFVDPQEAHKPSSGHDETKPARTPKHI